MLYRCARHNNVAREESNSHFIEWHDVRAFCGITGLAWVWAAVGDQVMRAVSQQDKCKH